MAYIIKKNIKGHNYYYAVQSAWQDGKSRIVWQKYLGKVDDIIAAVAGGELPKPYTAKVLEYGASAALLTLARKLNIVEAIDVHTSKRKQWPSVGQYILLAAINRSVAPTSKNKFAQWYETTCLSRMMGIDKKHLTSQRFWDHMGYLNEDIIQKVELAITRKIVQMFDLDLRCLIYDTTNFFTWIDTASESEIAQRGHNKAKRNDLKQVGLSLMVTRDFHIPLFHKVYAGNITDSVQFNSVTEELVTRYKEVCSECEDITIIFDKGNNSKDNEQAFKNDAFRFVGSLTPSHNMDLLTIPISEFTPLNGAAFGGVSAYRCKKKVMGVERTVVITYNESLYLGQMQGLVHQLRKANSALKELQKKLEIRSSKAKPKGKAPTLEGIEKQVKQILSGSPLKKLIRYQLKQDGSNIQLSYEIDHNAMKEYEQIHLGKNILFTSQDTWSNEEIVSAYRGQSNIEDAFKRMKDPHFISWSPMFHWTDEKIRVHAFYCVLALTLVSLLRKIVHQAGFEMSIPVILEELASVYEVAHIYPEGSGQKDHYTLSATSQLQQQLLDILEIVKEQ